MAIRIGINGFRRMGRLGLRAGWGREGMDVIQVNEIATDAAGSAHQLKFDSVHGTWGVDCSGEGDAMRVGGLRVAYSRNATIGETDWSGCDVVIEAAQSVTAEDVNGYFKEVAEGELKGILGYEERPLVSVDYLNDPRASVVDVLSTMVIDGNQVKIYAWYDDECGYVCRMMDIADKIARMM